MKYPLNCLVYLGDVNMTFASSLSQTECGLLYFLVHPAQDIAVNVCGPS